MSNEYDTIGVVSDIANITVGDFPIISTQPQNQKATPGSKVTFTVAATGSDLQYQWYKDGQPISGETQATLIILAAQFTDAKPYTVAVSNKLSTVTSDIATLTVYDPNLDIKIEPAISDMTINDTQVIDYLLYNKSGQSFDIAKIAGFNGMITRDNSVSGNCSVTLAANDSCKIRLKISPTQDGQISQMMNIGNNSNSYFAGPIVPYVHSLKIIYKNSTPVTYAFPGEQPEDGLITIENHSQQPISKLFLWIDPNAGANIKPLPSSCDNGVVASGSCSYNFKYYSKSQLSNKSRGSKPTSVPTITGVNSLVKIKYTQSSGDANLKMQVQSFFPSYNWFLSLPYNITKYNDLPIATKYTTNSIRSIFSQGDRLYITMHGTINADYAVGFAVSHNNGISWSSYTTAQGLVSNEVNGICASKDNVYVATSTGLSVSRNSGTTWSTYTTAQGLVGNYIRGVYCLDSNVYVATNTGLSISKDNGNSWTNYTTDQKLIDNNVIGVYASGDNIYVATSSGLSISNNSGSSWNSYTYQVGGWANGVYAAGSTIYVATGTLGLAITKDNGKTWSYYSTAQGLSNNIQMVYGSGKNVYVVYDDGLSVSRDGGTTWSNIRKNIAAVYVLGANVYAASTYTALNDGALFISSDDVATWSSYTPQNGLGSNWVNDVYVSGNSIYAPTTLGGLSISQDNGATWITYTDKQGLIGTIINSVKVLDGAIYASSATVAGGVAVSTNGGSNWNQYSTSQWLGSSSVWGLYILAGSVYAATNNGLSVASNSGASWSNHNISQGNDNYVRGFFGLDSNLYVGTLNGLWMSKDSGNTWNSYQSFPAKNIQAVYVTGNSIYAATYGNGLYISKDNGSTWSNQPTSGSSKISGMHVSENNIYIATDGGLSFSTDNGSTWSSYLPGQDTVCTLKVHGFSNKVYVATQGTGIWYGMSAP